MLHGLVAWPASAKPQAVLDACLALKAQLKEHNSQLRQHNALLRHCLGMPAPPAPLSPSTQPQTVGAAEALAAPEQ